MHKQPKCARKYTPCPIDSNIQVDRFTESIISSWNEQDSFLIAGRKLSSQYPSESKETAAPNSPSVKSNEVDCIKMECAIDYSSHDRTQHQNSPPAQFLSTSQSASRPSLIKRKAGF
jgi:hypothetical protein